MVNGVNAMLEDVSTVILYGENIPSGQVLGQRQLNLVKHNFNQLPNTVEELIVAKHIPKHYSLALYKTLPFVKRLSIHSYEGDFYDNPCKVCPNLEELTLEHINPGKFILTSCKRLKTVRVWNAAYAVNVSVLVLLLI